MGSVYKLWAADGYQELSFVNYNDYRREEDRSWKFNGEPIGDTFVPLEMYVRQTSLKKPDIWQVLGSWAFETRAKDILITCLEKAGELFELPFENRSLTVLNCTYVIDCLDTERSEYPPDVPTMIDKFVFHADRLDYSLFKIPQNPFMWFAAEGLAARQDEFKALIEDHKLTGITFQKVWTDES